MKAHDPKIGDLHKWILDVYGESVQQRFLEYVAKLSPDTEFDPLTVVSDIFREEYADTIEADQNMSTVAYRSHLELE